MPGILPTSARVASGPRGCGPSRRSLGRRRPAVEALESRRLLAVAFNEFPIPTPNSGPAGIAAAPDGALWFTESSSDHIGRITTAGAVTESPLAPGTHVVATAYGGSGGLDPSVSVVRASDVVLPPQPTPAPPLPKVPPSMIPAQMTDPASILLQGLYAKQAAAWSPQVAFFGDSLTFNFGFGLGSQVWAQSIAGLDAQDYGEPGDATQNILWRVENGELPAHPKVIVLQAGVDNLGGGESPEDTLAGIENLVTVIHNLAPASKILVVGIFPIGVPANRFRPVIVQINDQLARFVDNRSSFFLDINHSLLAPDGTLTAVSDDPYLIHINALGYQDWTDDMIGPLRLLLGLDPSPTAILPLPLNFSPFDVSNPDLSIAETTGLYESILGRAPDPMGLIADVNYLDGGGSLSTLASAMLHSAAYETNLVSSYYRTFAGRDGSVAEVATWVNLMQKGVGAEKIAYLMMTSDGFNGLHPDNASFLRAVFTDALGRAPAPAELAAWGSYMAGGVSRPAMVYTFLFSPAAAQNAVLGFASLFWATPIDPYTEAACVRYLTSDGNLADVAAAFASSPAFIARAAASVG